MHLTARCGDLADCLSRRRSRVRVPSLPPFTPPGDAALTMEPKLPLLELGAPRTDLRRQLVDAVLRGEKTATAGLLADFEAEGRRPGKVGARRLLAGYDDEPVAVIEITESRIVP